MQAIKDHTTIEMLVENMKNVQRIKHRTYKEYSRKQYNLCYNTRVVRSRDLTRENYQNASTIKVDKVSDFKLDTYRCLYMHARACIQTSTTKNARNVWFQCKMRCLHICTCLYTYARAHANAYSYKYAYTMVSANSWNEGISRTCMYVCMYVCIHVCLFACMYVYVYICIYV